MSPDSSSSGRASPSPSCPWSSSSAPLRGRGRRRGAGRELGLDGRAVLVPRPGIRGLALCPAADGHSLRHPRGDFAGRVPVHDGLRPGEDGAQLAALFGRLYAVASGINVFVSLLVFNRIVGRLGVPNTALIQPFVYVVTFGLLFAYPGEAAAVVAFLAHQAILTSIDFNNVNLLLKALPAEGKKAIRTLIEGLGEPFAVASAGALLLVLTVVSEPRADLGRGPHGWRWGVSASSSLLRTEYPAAMVQNLKREWVEFGSGKGVRETAQYIALGIEDSSEVVPLLQGTLDASARERRAVEMAVVVLGLKTVPSTLSILQDQLQPHRIRSLAARIAGRLAPAQLEAMAADLVESELERAVEYARARSALAAVERGAGPRDALPPDA